MQQYPELGIDSSNVRRQQYIRLDKVLSPYQWNIVKHIDEIAGHISTGKMTGEHDIAERYTDIRAEDLKGLDKKLDECRKRHAAKTEREGKSTSHQRRKSSEPSSGKDIKPKIQC